MPHKIITYRRAKLYGQVWAEPIRTVAKRHGVSDVALAKMCRKHDIPSPPPTGAYLPLAVRGAPRRVHTPP